MCGESRIVKCAKCDRELVSKQTMLEYLGHTVAHNLPTCPECGRVFISREVAEGKMAEVEQLLEEK